MKPKKGCERISRFALIASLFLIVISLTTCDLFSPGLGDTVDINAPEVGVESHGNGEYVSGILSLTGYARDDQGIESVSVARAAASQSASYSNDAWSTSIDTSGLTDGDHEFIVTATDLTGKASQVSIFLIVDNTPPTVLVTVPTDYATREFNKSIAIKGEATDTTRVEQVRISLFDALDNPIFADQIATGTTSWYHIFDASAFSAGTYYFSVTAEDKSGNTNTWFYTFADLLALASDPAAIPNIEEVHGADYQGVPIGDGVLSDTLASIRNTATAPDRMEISIDPNSDLPGFIFISPSFSVNPADNVLSSPQRLSGFVEDDDGVDTSTVRIALWDYSDNPDTDDPLIDHDWVAPTISGNQWTYSVNLPDGEYWMKLRADDIYGVGFTSLGSTSQAVAFRVSSFAPVVTITAPPQGSYLGTSSAVTVTANITGMGAGAVEIDPDGDDNYTNAVEMTENPVGSGTYEITLTAGTDFTVIDGQQTFKIRAGTTGNFGYATLQFTGDITPPLVTVEVPPADASVNGTFNVAGTSSDDNLVDSVYLWIEEVANSGDNPPADVTTWQTPDGSDVYNWIYNLDTTPLNAGDHTIHVAAFDAAGNQSAAYSRGFSVAQESDRPIINLSNLVEGGTTVDNGLGQDASFLGYIEDDDNVDVSTIEVLIDIGDDDDFSGVDLTLNGDTLQANESEQWTSISNPPGADGRIVNWSHLLTNLPQGQHSMWLRVHDVNSSGTAIEATNANYAETVETPFMIDFGPPGLIISSPVNNAIFNGDFTISGTATDPNGVQSVEISVDGGAFVAVMNEAPGSDTVTWDYFFDVSVTGDGDFAYQIKATDLSGGTTTLDRQVIVDAEVPTIIIEQPAAASLINGSTVTISGRANDNRSVSNVFVDVYPSAGSADLLPADWDFPNAGTFNWSVDLDTLAREGTDTPADFVISVMALDGAGNYSIEYTRTVTIDQGSDRPFLSFNDIDKAETLATNNVLVGATNLTGIVEDDDLVDRLTIEINIDNGGWGPVSTPPASNGKVVVWKHDISGLLEGVHSVKIRARDTESDGTVGASSVAAEYGSNFNWNIEDSADQSGVPFILNLGPPSVVISSPANYTYHNGDVNISGTAFDANGVDFVQISFDNGVTWLPTSGDPTAWSYLKTVDTTGPAYDDDGTYSYLIRATDTYGSTGVESGQFTVDATPPTAVISQPADGAVVNGDLTLQGTAEDNSNLDKVYYEIREKYTDAPTNSTLNSTPVFPDDYFEFSDRNSWNETIDTTGRNDEIYTLRVVALDKSSNASTVTTRDFTVDQETDRPVIDITTFSDSGTFGGNLVTIARKLSGTVSDDDGVDTTSMQYRLYEEDGTTEITSGWTGISGPPTAQGNWSHTFSAADGKYQVQLRASDIHDLGNYTAGEFGWKETGLFKMTLDSAAPVINLTTAPAEGDNVNDDFDIIGTVNDDGGLVSVTVDYSDGTAQAVELDDTTPEYGISQAVGRTFAVDRATHTDDGELTFTVTAVDASGRTSIEERTVTIDTRPPTVIISQPIASSTVNGEILVSGTSNDDNTGVTAVYYAINDGATPTFPDDYAAFTGKYSWQDTIDTAAYNNTDTSDAFTLWVFAVDNAGNNSISAGTPDSVVFNIDQGTDRPIISFSSITEGAGFTANLLPQSKQISGSVSDDDSVDGSTMEYRLYEQDGTTEITSGWTPFDLAGRPLDSTLGTWSHTLTQSDGKYQIQLRIADINDGGAYDGNFDWAESPLVELAVDTANPITDFDTSNGGSTNTDLIIRGTASDANGVATVEIGYDADTSGDIDADEWYGVDNFIPDSLSDAWDYPYSVDTSTHTDDGLFTYQVKVTDVYAKEQVYDRYITIDTTPATVIINQPESGTDVNGVITLRGTSADTGAGVAAVQYGVTSSNTVAPAYSDASGLYNWSAAYDTTSVVGPTTYYLWVQVEDLAGNISSPSIAASTIMDFSIDQSTDKPVVEFLSITETADGGSFATNELPLSQKISGSILDDDGVEASTVQYQLYEEDGSTLITDWTDVSGQPAANATFGTWSHTPDPLWADAKYQIRLRVADINALDDGFAYDDTYNWTETDLQQITVDSYSPAGTIDTLSVTSPYDGSSESPRPVVSGMLVNNSFDLTGTATDGNGVASVAISTNGGGTFDVLDGTEFTAPDWTYAVPIVRGGANDGELSILVRITDTVGKITDKTLTVNVDTVEPSTQLNYTSEMTLQAGVPTVDGPLAKIIGSVSDTGAISNVDRVDLFFVKGTDFYSPRAVANTPTGGDSVPSDASYIISVDNRFEIDDDSTPPGDNDGFLEGLRSKGTYDEWYALIDSTILPDGPIVVHQASYDVSGNRDIAASNIQVSNYPPSIDSISIWGTPYSEDDVRVKLDHSGVIDINASDDAHVPTGINTGSYELEVVEQYNRSGGEVGSLNASYDAADTYLFAPDASGSYTLDLDTLGLTDDYYYRVQARVKDVSDNIVTKDFYMWVYDSSSDTSAPTLTIDDLTVEDNAGPAGHIEEAADSPNDFADADISGTVTFTGTIYDDNPAPTVDLQVSVNGTDWTTITTGSSATVLTSGGTGGYYYDWSYTWDTSLIEGVKTNVAVLDLHVRALGSDAVSNTANSTELMVDIVPYITDITTGLEIGLKSYVKRSATGKYTVASGSEVTINGYNLAGSTAGSIEIGGVTVNPDSGSTTQQVVTLGPAHNGAVTVTTNGIDSQNNTNDNDLAHNKEILQYYPDRNDDRYIALWQLTDTGYSGSDAVMRPVRDAGGNQTDMDWMYVTTSDTLYLSGVKMTSSFTLSGGDFVYNTTGSRLWTFLHDAKWWTEIDNDTNTAFHGSIQWSMQNGYDYDAEVALGNSGIYPQAYNWNMDQGRLGLGNMVYPEGTSGQIDRYQNIQFRAAGTDADTDNLIAFYDGNATNEGIAFISFETGTGITGYDLGTWNSTIDRVMTDDKAYSPTGNENSRATGLGNPVLTGSATDARNTVVSGSDSSSDFAFAYSGGVAYLAWYDPDTGGTGGFAGAGLKFMYNTTPITNPLSGWTAPVTVVNNAQNTEYSHIAMAVDSSGGIHIAYQDNNSGFLNYTYAASRTDMGTTMNTLLLDALFSSGQYNSIVIKDFNSGAGTDYRPVITTFSSAYTGTKQSLRVLYPAGPTGSVSMLALGDGADINGDFTGAWESIAIPSSTAPRAADTFTETGGAVSGDGYPLIGYNGLFMEEAQLLDLQ